MFNDKDRAGDADAHRRVVTASLQPQVSPSTSASAPAPAQTIHRYTIVPAGHSPSASSTRLRTEYGAEEDLRTSLLTDQRLFAFFPSPECPSAPETLRVWLPDDLFALQAVDDALERLDDVADGDEEGRDGELKTRPNTTEEAASRERVAVLSGSGTSGTMKSLRWALRTLEKRVGYTAQAPEDAQGTQTAPLLQLHATPVDEYKTLSCLLVRLPTDSQASEAEVALVDGPLFGLHYDRPAQSQAATGDRGISTAWVHDAVKVKRGDWKDMDAVMRDEAQDRGRLQMQVADKDEAPIKTPAVKRAKKEVDTPVGSSGRRATSATVASAPGPNEMPKMRHPASPPAAQPLLATSAAVETVSARGLEGSRDPTTTASAPSTPLTGASTPAVSSSDAVATMGEAVLLELLNAGQRAAPFKDWQKLVLKRLPEYREISLNMKSPDTRHIATRWLEEMKEKLRVWLTADKGFLIDPQGNVVGY